MCKANKNSLTFHFFLTDAWTFQVQPTCVVTPPSILRNFKQLQYLARPFVTILIKQMCTSGPQCLPIPCHLCVHSFIFLFIFSSFFHLFIILSSLFLILSTFLCSFSQSTAFYIFFATSFYVYFSISY